MRNNGGEIVSFFAGMVIGLTVGSLITLLTTPYTGKEVRGKIAKRGKDTLKRLREIKDQLEREIEEKGRGLKGEAAEKVSELRKKVDELFANLEK
ncbi:MAG: YtxH domain-containing protein [candidate division WOR-3 bacterium]